jgi:hypothetical protein
MKYPEWIIDQIIPAEAVSMVYGRSGKGKSFWALDWALCVASGKNWNGRAVKSGHVVYVAGEGRSGYAARIQAWERQNNQGRGAFGLYTRPVRLWHQPESVQTFIDEVNAAALRPVLVVLDTLGTSLSGANENDNGHMREVLDSAEDIGRAFGGAAVLLVHHTGKVGDTPRGAQALQDGVAMHAHLTGDGKTWGMLSCGKQKDAEPFEAIKRELHKVPLGKDASSLSFADDRRTGQRDPSRRRVGWADVRGVLAGSGIPMTPRLVALALEWDREAAKKALQRAEGRGEVYQPDGGGAYALVPNYVPNVPNVPEI